MRYLITLTTLFISLAAVGEQNADGTGSHFACKDDLTIADVEKSVHFPHVQAAAVRANNEFCASLNSQPGVPDDVLRDFGVFLERNALNTDFGTARLNADVRSSMGIMSSALGERLGPRFRTPDFDAEEVDENKRGGTFFFSVSVLEENFFQPSADEEAMCARRFSTAADCLAVFEDLARAIAPYKSSYQRFIGGENQARFAKVSSEWDRYFQEARTQTTVDLLLTSVIARDHIRKGYIVGPPRVQWFALRPNMILQYHEGAPKGDQFKPGLAVEWAGFNFWDESPLPFPFGLSLTTVYSDMPGVQTVGHGVTIHIDNRFSIGWTRHDGDSSYHVSADLLQFFKEKQDRFDDYRNRFDALIEPTAGQGTQ